LAAYPNVTLHASSVLTVEGVQPAFRARLSDGSALSARRVLLCTGLIDDLPAVPGLHELWGRSIFQCPYCHGWEVQGARFAYWASTLDTTDFAIFLRGWSDDVVLLTSGQVTVPEALHERLAAAHVRIDEREIRRVVGDDAGLRQIEFADGQRLSRDVLFLHPPQRQVPLVHALALATDARGFIHVDEARRTSIPGIYAAGDLTTHAQSAILAAAAGMQAAAALNHELTLELALGESLAFSGDIRHTSAGS
jgi:thioredoxin reductase